MLRFASLGSGSRGNATLIESSGSRVLLDCGFSTKELEKRLAIANVDPATIDALVVTHEHADHIKGAASTARRYGIELWMSHGTRLSSNIKANERLNLFHADHGSFSIGDITISPFTVPHDAREPCQYLFSSRQVTLGVLTDTGSVTSHIVEALTDADALILECNHDEQMLAEGPYPPRLKMRVGGVHGHLSNRQAAALLARLDSSRLQRLVAAHLSEKNNAPDKAREALLDADPLIESKMSILAQDDVADWVEVVS